MQTPLLRGCCTFGIPPPAPGVFSDPCCAQPGLLWGKSFLLGAGDGTEQSCPGVLTFPHLLPSAEQQLGSCSLSLCHSKELTIGLGADTAGFF